MRAHGSGRAGPPRSSAVAAALAMLSLAFMGIACGTPANILAERACPYETQSGYRAQARLIIAGIMLAGPTANVRGETVLVSPAKMRVTRYLKGTGPGVVRVVTRIQNGNVIKRRGIEPQAGQRWLIYTRSANMPYVTTICQGSRLTGGPS